MIVLIFLCAPISLIYAQDIEKKVTPPKTISYDDRTLNYNPAWEDKEIYLEANLDNDADKEVVIGFVASYKPTSSIQEEKRESYDVPKQELTLIQNYCFYQIYDKGPDGYYALVKTIHGMDRLGKVETVKLDEKGPDAIAIFSPGGEHYEDLSIYRFRDGGYRLLFDQGTSGTTELGTQKTPVSIRICNGEKCEIFVWDPSVQAFKHAQ